ASCVRCAARRRSRRHWRSPEATALQRAPVRLRACGATLTANVVRIHSCRGVSPTRHRAQDRAMRAPAVALLLCLLPLAGGARAQSADAGTVTVYRCTDAGGHQALRDTPCPAGQKQQAREMVRPKDAPPKPVAPPAPATTPAPRPETRTVYLVPPMPLYECTTPDGARYTSEDGD